MDITTLAMAKKFAKEYTDTHASKLTEEDAVRAVANYFNENPNAIVTNDELEIILNEYFKKDDLSDLEDIRTGAALGATALQEHQDISGKADKTDIENVIYYEDGEESDVDEVVLMSEFEAANNELKDSIAEKLNAPTAGLEIGKILKVTAVNDDGSFTCEWADAPSGGGVTDVQINGKSIITDGVAHIPISKSNWSESSGYVLRKTHIGYGLVVLDGGTAAIYMADKQQINGRSTNYNPIVPRTLDYAVKAAICDGKGDAWTDAEKIGAWKRLNSIKTVIDDIAVAGAQYYLGEQIAVSVVLPDNAEIGQMITVCWYNGNHAATLSITGTMLDFDFVPSANSRSEINALWDGTYWAVLGNEMSVPREVTA